MLAIVGASATRAQAAGIAAKSLDHPELIALPRIGAIIVGYDAPEVRAGYYFAAASLVDAMSSLACTSRAMSSMLSVPCTAVRIVRTGLRW